MNGLKACAVLLAGASCIGMSAAALAQDAAADQSAQPTDPEIVVTGSRVISNGNNSPSPVTVVQTSDLLATQPGANLADALNVLPVFAGSRGAGSNPTSTGTASGGNGSANQLNLRNIGITRTLVLMDGLRIPPTLFNGAVDVDMVPQMLVKRVDVVTGGVSAVYGSDAISGVVNYVLDKKLEGLKLEASGGISRYGDAQQLDAGAAWGTNFAGGRGHFEASYQYHDFAGILRRSDRPYMNQWGVTGAGTEANPYVNGNNVRQSNYPFGGLITSGTALKGMYFSGDGVLSTFTHGTATGTSGVEIGGDGGYYDSSLLQPLKSHQVFGRLDYELTDSIKAHVQVAGTMKTNTNYQDYIRLAGVTLRSDNAFLPAQYQTALAVAGESTFKLSEFVKDAGRFNGVAKSDQWLFSGGLEGKLGGWNWGIDYIKGRTVLNTTIVNNLNNQHLAAALDAVTDPSTGQVVCYSALVDPAHYGDCQPLDVFGPTAVSQAAINYIMEPTHYRAVTDTDDVTAQISGSPFKTWAGPFKFALSAEWRRIAFSSSTDGSVDDKVDCTSIRANCTSGGGLWYLTFASSPKVSQAVWEVAGEFDAPLLADVPFAQSLNVNGAARYTHYTTSGNYVTWKVGLDWHVSDVLAFRGTRSRDIRAPTLFDLYAPRNVVNVTTADLLTGQTVLVPNIDGSNPDLKAEIANTITGGVVIKPKNNLSFAVDAYKINIRDAILTINGGQAAFQNACYASGGSSPYCALQDRPGSFTDTSPSNSLTALYNVPINLSEIETWGIDVEANWSTKIGTHPLMLRLLGSYQPHVYYRQPEAATTDQGGVAFGPIGLPATPSVRLVGFARFKPSDNVTIDVMERWRNAMKLSGEDGQVWVNNHLAAFATTSVTIGYDFKSAMGTGQFYISVQNLFDADPPGGTYYGNGTRAGLRDGYSASDDPRGRYFTAGIKLTL